ncbi:MAG: hypothetical protein L0332_16490 [Chloroflexi bacterium]|nr:hypothetical protein [Chloroflexota bacterium]MCI0579103.1 hypothetical protein [Chloroflexota bacterium]MCI0650075.1 hypothetical protein [Chloroflexota bacterium]MCI0728299.1 hypothetical protein [Chloroflexota bacterium]
MDQDDSLTLRLMADMPPELLQFIRSKVTSFVKLDLLRFLHENQFTYDTAENIAHYVGHDEAVIKAALEKLLADGVLEVTIVNNTRVYSLSKDGAMRNIVSQFVEACEDAEFRTKVIFHILRGMR